MRPNGPALVHVPSTASNRAPRRDRRGRSAGGAQPAHRSWHDTSCSRGCGARRANCPRRQRKLSMRWMIGSSVMALTIERRAGGCRRPTLAAPARLEPTTGMAPNRHLAATAPDPHLIAPVLAAWLSVFRSCFTAPVWTRVLVLVQKRARFDHGIRCQHCTLTPCVRFCYWFNPRKRKEGRKTDSCNSIVDIWGPSPEALRDCPKPGENKADTWS